MSVCAELAATGVLLACDWRVVRALTTAESRAAVLKCSRNAMLQVLVAVLSLRRRAPTATRRVAGAISIRYRALTL